jgi:hypothetical protein
MSLKLHTSNITRRAGGASQLCVEDAPAVPCTVHVPFLVHESNWIVANTQQCRYQFATTLCTHYGT